MDIKTSVYRYASKDRHHALLGYEEFRSSSMHEAKVETAIWGLHGKSLEKNYTVSGKKESGVFQA